MCNGKRSQDRRTLRWREDTARLALAQRFGYPVADVRGTPGGTFDPQVLDVDETWQLQAICPICISMVCACQEEDYSLNNSGDEDPYADMPGLVSISEEDESLQSR